MKDPSGCPWKPTTARCERRPIIAATRQRYSACRHGIGAKHLISRTCTPSTLVVRSTGPAEQADIVAEAHLRSREFDDASLNRPPVSGEQRLRPGHAHVHVLHDACLVLRSAGDLAS